MSGADPENELGGANSGGLGDRSPLAGSRGGAPIGGPPEADDFSQLKGYLDVTSGILGGMAPLPPPLNPPVFHFLPTGLLRVTIT